MIRPARVADLDGLVGIENSVFVSDRLSRRAFARRVASASCALLVAERDARLAGYALVEFRRVLRPGGLLIAPTFLHASGGSDVPSGPRVSPSATSAAGGPAAVEGRGGRAPGLTQTLFDLDGLVALVAAAGFDVVDAEEIPGRVPIGYVTARRPDAVALT